MAMLRYLFTISSATSRTEDIVFSDKTVPAAATVCACNTTDKKSSAAFRLVSGSVATAVIQ